MIKTILFNYYATGEGSLLQFVIVNHNRGVETFFEKFNILEKDRDWFKIGLEEFDNIPEIVQNYLSQNIVNEILEEQNDMNIEMSFSIHRNI